MAVLGSNGVAWKVSSFTKSDDCGDCVGCAAGLRPVIESQLREALAIVYTAGEVAGVDVHSHLGMWPGEVEEEGKLARSSKRLSKDLPAL